MTRVEIQGNFGDLMDTLKGIKRYAEAAYEHIPIHLGNNLVALSRQAIDQLMRAEVVVEDQSSSLTEADVAGLYEQRSHVNIDKPMPSGLYSVTECSDGTPRKNVNSTRGEDDWLEEDYELKQSGGGDE